MPKRKKSANAIIEALEVSAKLQDIYEYVSGRDLVFVEIPEVRRKTLYFVQQTKYPVVACATTGA